MTINQPGFAIPADPYGPTTLIDSDNRRIVALANHLAPFEMPVVEKVGRIFVYVRDTIKFGFGPRFYEHTASEIAELGVGYCNTKGTLMVALLRAAGIGARQVFVDIDANILSGIVDPGTAFVDHSYVEILISGKWVATDAYIIDRPLFAGAKKRLDLEGKTIGYGIHRFGTFEFSHERATFSQFVRDQSPVATTRNYGVHADVAAFYDATPETWNRLQFITRRAFPIFAALANRNAEKLRELT